MTEKPIIGQTTCCDCGAKVNVRRDAGGKGYWYCSGELEGTGCTGRHTMGHGTTREMLTAEIAKKVEPEPAKPKKTRKENPPKQEIKTDDKPDGNDSRRSYL